MRIFTLASTILISAMAATPAAAVEEDFGVWLAQSATISTSDSVDIRLEAQERFNDDASRLGQLLLRPAIGYKLSEDASLFAGYAYVMTDPEGPVKRNEHRIFQELNVRLFNDGEGTTISSRSRLEQRFLEEADGTALRFRQQVQLKTPISEKVSAVLYTEPFIGLNEKAFQRDGIGVWRNFVGASVPVGEGFSLTGGYLNQYVVRSGEDRTQHIINIGIGGRF